MGVRKVSDHLVLGRRGDGSVAWKDFQVCVTRILSGPQVTSRADSSPTRSHSRSRCSAVGRITATRSGITLL